MYVQFTTPLTHFRSFASAIKVSGMNEDTSGTGRILRCFLLAQDPYRRHVSANVYWFLLRFTRSTTLNAQSAHFRIFCLEISELRPRAELPRLAVEELVVSGIARELTSVVPHVFVASVYGIKRTVDTR